MAPAQLSIEELERALACGKNFYVTRMNEPWVLAASSADYCDAPPKPKGPKDSTHVPFYRNLPRHKRR